MMLWFKHLGKRLLALLLVLSLLPMGAPPVQALNYFPYVSLQFLDGVGSPLSGPIQLRVSLWSRFDVKSNDIQVSGALNTASDFYGGFQAVMVVPALDIKTVAGQGGLYRLYLPSVASFPTNLDSDSAYLQVEVMETPGGLDTEYEMYDFFDDPPDQIVTRLQIFEDTSTISRDPGQGTYFDSFVIDNNADATTQIDVVFGQILNERLSWDISNDYFFLSDSLVVDGNINVQGTTIRLDSDEIGNPDQDVEIVAEQGTEPDGIIRYDDGNNRWELSNDGVSFDEISTFTQIDLDDAYNNFFANPVAVSVDGAQGQTTGITFNGSISDETLTVTNSGSGGAVLFENTGSGTSFRVNDSAADATPFVIDASGLVGIGTATPDTNLHIEDTASSAATEWLKFDDGTNEVSMLTGTQDPKLVATDADVGSFFFNSSNGLFYIKQDDGLTTNWNQLGLTDDVNDALLGTFGSPGLSNKFVTDTDPRLSATSGGFGEVALGTRLDYLGTKKINRSVIFYTRIFLPSDTTVNSIGAFTTSSATGDVNMGIYDDNGGVPNNLVASTGTQTGVTAPVNGFWEFNLSTPYDVTTAGIYWLAMAVSVQPFARTYDAAEDIFIAYRVESKTNGSTTLPATATPSAVGNTLDLPYFAAFE